MAQKTETRAYEAMFLADPADAASWGDLAKHLTGILERYGAEIVGITRWDERKLAYPVAKRKRGTYVLSFFGLKNGDAVHQIERDCQLSEKVLRALILRADHFKVADMRMQLGEDVHEEVAVRLAAERGEAPQNPPPAKAQPAAGTPADV
ncbi:MAG: 30S ribosomal protein S6 [Phycisphaerae bacterium]|nr:30S ribosomal protein S6 [Phycisphaerae bacterium]